jgi:tetratricopeptide (TPR) repeat protein
VDRGGKKGLASGTGPDPETSGRGRLEAALSDLIALAQRQESAVATLRLAIARSGGPAHVASPAMLSRLEDAVAAFAKTCAAVAEIYGELDEWEKGSAWARKVLAMASDAESRAEASLMLAVTLQRSGWYPEALEAFRAALAQGLEDPRLASGANEGAADCLLEMGRASEAEPYCHAALGLCPNDPSAIFTLARCLLLQGAWEPAVRCLVDAAEAGVPGADLQVYGLMDRFGSLPEAEFYFPEVKALFETFLQRTARLAAGRRSDA